MLEYSMPFFYEDSNVPVVLSKISPIEISAITLGPFVFSRGKISETTRIHETIHWQQYIETGIIGFLVLYLLFWVIGLFKYRSGVLAYRNMPFEHEAYKHQNDISYLFNRSRYEWCRLGYYNE